MFIVGMYVYPVLAPDIYHLAIKFALCGGDKIRKKQPRSHNRREEQEDKDWEKEEYKNPSLMEVEPSSIMTDTAQTFD